MLAQRPLERPDRTVEIPAGGEQQTAAASPGSQRPGAIELPPTTLERVEQHLGAVELTERDQRLERVWEELDHDRLGNPGLLDGLGQWLGRLPPPRRGPQPRREH